MQKSFTARRLILVGFYANLDADIQPLLNCIISRLWEIAVHLAVACGVYGDVFLCCPFSHEVSWMRS